MKVDDFTIKIIKEFYNIKNGEKITAWDLCNKIFRNLAKTQRRRKYQFIKERLKLMSNKIFRLKRGEKFWHYDLMAENVVFKTFKFPNGIKPGMALFINEKWIIYET